MDESSEAFDDLLLSMSLFGGKEADTDETFNVGGIGDDLLMATDVGMVELQ